MQEIQTSRAAPRAPGRPPVAESDGAGRTQPAVIAVPPDEPGSAASPSAAESPECSVGKRPKVSKRAFRAYFHALPAGTVLLPGIAAVASITLYLAENWIADSPAEAYAIGTLLAVASWFLLPFLLRRYAFVDRANPSTYSQLVEVYSTLRQRAQGVDDPSPSNSAALDAACVHLNHVARELGLYEDGSQPTYGLRWVLATGYVGAWRHLHRAEEALVLVEHETAVIGTAAHDDLRLSGSKIAGADHLRMKLRAAVSVLNPDAEAFLNPAPAGLAKIAVAPSEANKGAARAVLSSLRRTINEYRDDRREGLVRARNNLYATAFFVGIVAYLLLGLAMLTVIDKKGVMGVEIDKKGVMGVEIDNVVTKEAILAGAAFYLVGALVGLFRQLRAAATGDGGAEEDFGLSTARLLQTPLFAGIAAVAGAALVRVLPAMVPEAGVTGDTKRMAITLEQVFDLGHWPEGLVWAAVFGLTPTLLIATLQRRAEQYKRDLKTSEAGEGTPGEGTSAGG